METSKRLHSYLSDNSRRLDYGSRFDVLKLLLGLEQANHQISKCFKAYSIGPGHGGMSKELRFDMQRQTPCSRTYG